MAVAASIIGGVACSFVVSVVGYLAAGDRGAQYGAIGGLVVGFFVGRAVYERCQASRAKGGRE